MSVHKVEDFCITEYTCVEISISLSCLFVHEPLYQTRVVCCNSVFVTVLCVWITVPFSMLEWGWLRLIPNQQKRRLKKIVIWVINKDCFSSVEVELYTEIGSTQFYASGINDIMINSQNTVETGTAILVHIAASTIAIMIMCSSCNLSFILHQ